jgi:4,5-dihydroxyphthalate decarboxylase
MSDLKLTFACWNYDRMRALADGRVKPEGIDLNCISLFPGETFQRMVKYREFDVAELGLKNYVHALDAGDPAFIAIPVYPVRLFLHSAIFVNKRRVSSPKDLVGGRVGELFSFGHDAAIWARGILQDDYGIKPESVSYHVGRLDASMRRDWLPFKPPAHIRVEPIRPDQTLEAMLQAGELDAIYSAIVPKSVLKGDSDTVGRLFENYEAVERDWFKRTRVFPIVHVVVIRKDLYDRHRWIAQSLYKAFKAAKDEAQRLYDSQAANMHRLFMTPWLTPLQEENRRLMGDDLWPYGLDANRKALDLFLRYHHEQGLSKRRFTPDDLFAPETLVEYVHGA